jgi:hypothetical protein
VEGTNGNYGQCCRHVSALAWQPHRRQLLVASSPCFCSLRLRRSIIDFRLITSSCCSTQSSIIQPPPPPPPPRHTHTFTPAQFPARAAANPATRLRRRYSHVIGSHSHHHHTCVGNLHPVRQSRQRHGRRVPVKLCVLSETKSFGKNAALFGRFAWSPIAARLSPSAASELMAHRRTSARLLEATSKPLACEGSAKYALMSSIVKEATAAGGRRS